VAFISLTHPKLSTPQRRLPGSPHWGGDWTIAVRALRAALENATRHGRWWCWPPVSKGSRFTPDLVGTEVIDLVNQLDNQSLAVLHVVIGELVKLSKKQAQQW
jgi:hypothetical protein